VKVEILGVAKLDLLDGFHFYEEQEAGLGSLFLNSIYSNIELLRLYAGIHLKPHKNFHRLLSGGFPLRFTIPFQTRRLLSTPLWIAGAIRLGSNNDWNNFQKICALNFPRKRL
jgi:hypothetical protein